MTEREALEKWEQLMKGRPDLAGILEEWMVNNKAIINRNSNLTIEDLKSDEELCVVASPDYCAIKGSKQAVCGCGTRVWLSPSTQEVMTQRGAAPTRIICSACWRRTLETNLEA